MRIEDFNEDNLRQMFDLFQQGVTLGDFIGYEEREYAAVYALGHQYYTQGQYTDAMKAFGFLAMHNHLEPKYLMAYASSLQMMQHYQDAIDYYCQASFFDLSDPLPTFHTAECLMLLGRFDDAHTALMTVLNDCADKPEHDAMRLKAQTLLDLLAEAKQNINAQGDNHGS